MGDSPVIAYVWLTNKLSSAGLDGCWLQAPRSPSTYRSDIHPCWTLQPIRECLAVQTILPTLKFVAGRRKNKLLVLDQQYFILGETPASFASQPRPRLDTRSHSTVLSTTSLIPICIRRWLVKWIKEWSLKLPELLPIYYVKTILLSTSVLVAIYYGAWTICFMKQYNFKGCPSDSY